MLIDVNELGTQSRVSVYIIYGYSNRAGLNVADRDGKIIQRILSLSQLSAC